MSDFTYSVWVGDRITFQSSDHHNAWMVYEQWVENSMAGESSAKGKLIKLCWKSAIIDAFDGHTHAALADFGYFAATA